MCDNAASARPAQPVIINIQKKNYKWLKKCEKVVVKPVYSFYTIFLTSYTYINEVDKNVARGKVLVQNMNFFSLLNS